MSIGNILRKLFWCLMNFASTLFIASLYLIKSKFLYGFSGYLWLDSVFSLLLFVVIPLVISIACLKAECMFCPEDSLKEPVQKVSSANKEYLPVYLSYFFVSLSIPGAVDNLEWGVLAVFVVIIWIFTSVTTTYYFNPLLLVLGYKFYNVVSHNGIELFVITKRTIGKGERDIVFLNLRKITEYVYVEVKEVDFK